jgi:hypothetical protein
LEVGSDAVVTGVDVNVAAGRVRRVVTHRFFLPLAVVLGILTVLVVAKKDVPSVSSATPRFDLTLYGPDGQQAKFSVDQVSGFVVVTGGRDKRSTVVVSDDRVRFELEPDAQQSLKATYLSAPSAAALPEGLDLSPRTIAAILDRPWRTCTTPTPVEVRIIQRFFSESFGLICAGGLGTDDPKIYTSAVRRSNVISAPPASETARVEDIGPVGDAILASLRQRDR